MLYFQFSFSMDIISYCCAIEKVVHWCHRNLEIYCNIRLTELMADLLGGIVRTNWLVAMKGVGSSFTSQIKLKFFSSRYCFHSDKEASLPIRLHNFPESYM